MINKIAILTSGGDSPGMNAAVRAIVKTAIAKNITPYLVFEGYKGLYENNIKECNSYDVSDKINLGGTFIKSARFPEFKDEEIRKVAIKNLDSHGIDSLVVVGGDGSYMGAKKLTEAGYPCIGLPGTIDNDISNTDYTIGFDTALDTITRSIDKIRDTSSSHHRCTIVEVMGRHCGDLALHSAIATGADSIMIPNGKSIDQVIKEINLQKEDGKYSFVVIVTELLLDVHELAKKIEAETGIETRASVLGHMQRGGSPSPFDRVLATKMGNFAVDLLLKGEKGRAVGIKNNVMVHDDIIEVVNGNKWIPNKELLKVIEETK